MSPDDRMAYPGFSAYQRGHHLDLATVLRVSRARARLTGYRRGPNKIGRHFVVLCADMLHARRQGIAPRILRGAGIRRML